MPERLTTSMIWTKKKHGHNSKLHSHDDYNEAIDAYQPRKAGIVETSWIGRDVYEDRMMDYYQVLL